MSGLISVCFVRQLYYFEKGLLRFLEHHEGCRSFPMVMCSVVYFWFLCRVVFQRICGHEISFSSKARLKNDQDRP